MQHLIQDVIAPDVRELKVRVASLEKQMDVRFDALEPRFDGIDLRFDSVASRFDSVNARLDTMEKKADGSSKPSWRPFASRRRSRS